MAASSTLLPLVLLLAASMATTAYGVGGHHRLTHIHLYMRETSSGPNATSFAVVQSIQGGDTTFGRVELLDNELRDGPDPANSSLVGRFQGLVAYAGLVTPPGMQSALSFLFTAGKHRGSSLVMMGTILSFDGSFERAVVGGTGAFRMARGYCIMKAVSDPALASVVYESIQGGDTTFGRVELLDNELRDGPDPANSSLVGRFQGLVAYAGLVTPPGMQSALSFLFTAGKHRGSSLVMMGTILSFDGSFERAVVGGTGAFRMARGYCIMKAVSDPALASVVYEVNMFVKKDV